MVHAVYVLLATNSWLAALNTRKPYDEAPAKFVNNQCTQSLNSLVNKKHAKKKLFNQNAQQLYYCFILRFELRNFVTVHKVRKQL